MRTHEQRQKRARRLLFEPLEQRAMLAPLAADDSYVAPDIITIGQESGVLANDKNLDGGALTAALITPPADGKVALSGDGSFTYEPDDDFSGVDSFVYAASDGTMSAEAVAYVTVMGEDDQLDDTSGFGIPDTMGAVGPQHIVQMLNQSYSVFDKATGKIIETMELQDFWNTAYVPARSLNEMQRLRISGSFPWGNVILAYGPLLQRTLSPNPSASDIQQALDSMFGAGNTKVVPKAAALGSLPSEIDVVFCGPLSGTLMQPLTLTSDMQYVEFSDASLTGMFTLSFALPNGTVITAPILLSNKTRLDAQAAINATLGPGKATVHGAGGHNFYVAFGGALAGDNQPAMTVKGIGLGGAPNPTVTARQPTGEDSNEVQRLAIGGSPNGGTFTLSA